MKKLVILLIIFQTSIFKSQNTSEEKPNIIVVLADDVGVGDISKYRRLHNPKIIVETPNIDKLATSGMMFTNAHAPAALCATSRYSFNFINTPKYKSKVKRLFELYNQTRDSGVKTGHYF